MTKFERAENEYYKQHAPYDEVDLYCEDCGAEKKDLCICEKKKYT